MTNCPHCPAHMTPCLRATEGLQCRAWLCPSCGHIEPAIGRERMLAPGDGLPVTRKPGAEVAPHPWHKDHGG